MYADYDFYTSKFLGSSIGEDEFPSLELKARMYIENYTNRDVSTIKNERTIEKVKMCICAVADVIKEYDDFKAITIKYQNSLMEGGSVVASESLGKQSVTYQKAETMSINQIEAEKKVNIDNLIRFYLSSTDLLYAGVPYVV